MSRSRIGVCAIAAVALAAPGVASADRSLTIVVRSVIVSQTPHDVKPKGFSKGDWIVGVSDLHNRQRQFGKAGGVVVGRQHATITFKTPTSATVRGFAEFPGGTVSFRGSGRTNAPTTVAVVGGTGSYKGAKGTVTSTTGNSPVITFKLRLPS
jgi:hypothetical protein